MKTKRRELQTFLMGLQECGKYGDVKFAYAVVKNRKAIRDEMTRANETAQGIIKPDPKFDEYESKRMALIKELADKDDKGQVIVNNNQAQLIEHKEEFEKRFTELNDEYKEMINVRNEQYAKANQFMEDDCEIEFVKVPLAELPKELNADILEKMMFMVSE